MAALLRLIYCRVDDSVRMMLGGVGMDESRAWANQAIFNARLDDKGL